ncbi:MAG: hypothetical protein OMM_04014 [Candidatus Magnetoglobus multicellularis str. Araruama]|uniref:Cytoskeleton protein RodZ-like C-terminal domain-containing protein n=1 Tax=Candidatus Magnetoglobus multicellularis str. Araruama TaxID=890399 RepID=A0A1V1P3J4_9BACT|nr:MAG: hypothetical protein OMM_04014 [Candidatus Magnetoglobus multicellularis str. Araruama]
MNDQSNTHNVYSDGSLGAFLRSEREKQGLNLNDIFQVTKIRPNILEYIESDQFDRVSTSDLFLISFLKAYSQALKLDPDPVIKRYKAAVAKKDAPTTKKSFANKGVSPQLMVASLAIILLICFIVMIVPSIKTYFSPNKKEEPPRSDVLFGELDNDVDFSYHNKPVTFTEHHPVSSTANLPHDLQVPVNEPEQTEQLPKNRQSADKYSLRLKAIEKTWLKITVDDQPPNEFMLKPGDILSKEADTEFQLLLGNATGLEIYLNDEPVKIGGRPGQVKTLRLP